jgi:hypothetical protein
MICQNKKGKVRTMAKEILEALFGDSYKDIRPIEDCLTIKTDLQCEYEEALYKWTDETINKI